MKFIIWIGVLAGAAAHATCDHRLVAARWDAVKGLDAHDPLRRAEVTRLLNEALSPGLRRLRELVAAARPEDLRRALATEPARGPAPRRDFDSVLRARGRYGFDGEYRSAYFYPNGHAAPFTDFNAPVMRKLARAVHALERLRLAPALGETVPSPLTEVMAECSYAGPRFATQIAIGGEAMLTAAAQLTADPVGAFDAEALLRRVTESGLIVRLALALPPAVLGPHGGQVFVRDAVTPDGARLSPKYRSFLRRARAIHRGRRRVTYALDHGCPVAHPSASAPPSLAAYVATVMTLYDAIAD